MVYYEYVKNKYIYRTFEPTSINDGDLVWHRDKRDRTVLIVSGLGWKFQYDNQLPIDLKPNDNLIIKANVYHRLIKNKDSTPLIIRIEEGS